MNRARINFPELKVSNKDVDRFLYKMKRSSAWRRSRKHVAVDLLPKCTVKVEAMAILTHFRGGYYIVVRVVGRPVPTNTQGLGAKIDVAHFGSRFVSTYSAKI